MERVMGIEPTFEAWEAPVLPLNYTRLTVEDPGLYGGPIKKGTDLFSVFCTENKSVPFFLLRKFKRNN